MGGAVAGVDGRRPPFVHVAAWLASRAVGLPSHASTDAGTGRRVCRLGQAASGPQPTALERMKQPHEPPSGAAHSVPGIPQNLLVALKGLLAPLLAGALHLRMDGC
jgi:hypothetical protein